jgi:hypothetical protein
MAEPKPPLAEHQKKKKNGCHLSFEFEGVETERGETRVAGRHIPLKGGKNIL